MSANITSAAAQIQQENLQMQAGTKINKMELDNTEAQGDAVVAMIEMQKNLLLTLAVRLIPGPNQLVRFLLQKLIALESLSFLTGEGLSIF